MEQTKQYEYVDLGLPSGLKWAKCNVGAEKETDYGYYFQWGEIENHGNSAYRCTHYKYYNILNTYDTLTKYNNDSSCGTVDNKTTLDLEDDAARANMGGDWRMPTRSDFQELLENTENEWIEDFNSTGVNGRKFTSKTDENKYIFIPASGYRTGYQWFGAGYFSFVWSSSLYSSNIYTACVLDFDSYSVGVDENRCRVDGLVVRGVMD